MKKYKFIAATALAALMLAACGDESKDNKVSKDLNETAESRIITDQLNREVEIKSTDRLVVGGILPYFSTWFVATNSTEEIVGLHPNAYNAASNSILKDISPDIVKAKTNFMENGEINIEQLLTLNPDVYFEIANQEKSVNKVAESGIPTVALDTNTDSLDPLNRFKSWVALTGEITGTTERPDKIVAEAEANQAMIKETLEKANIKEEDKPRVFFLQYHSDGEISTAGTNMHGNRWLNATGGIDVAAEAGIDGIKAINMEQVYEMNPDIIIITNFTETQPEDLYNNAFQGQDWSQVKAVKEGKVFKEPLGIYRWYPPSGDGPLMLKWMAQKLYPELFTYDMGEEIKTYYNKYYGYDLSDAQVQSILNPPSEAAKY